MHVACVTVDGTMVAVEHDDGGVEAEQDHVPTPVIFIHPKAELTSYDGDQTAAN